MDSCCELGAQISRDSDVLYRTDNFSVTPALGQIGIEGYLLVCSNEHYIGIGDMADEFDIELEEVLAKTKNVIKNNYSVPLVVFEHGPRCGSNTGGSCIDHAHLHIVPTRADLLNFMKEDGLKLEALASFSKLREIYQKGEFSYLFI